MIHLFRVSSTHSDLFISLLDLKKKEIHYTVRDKETGILLEPPLKSKITITDKQILFDGARFIDLGYAQGIAATLH